MRWINKPVSFRFQMDPALSSSRRTKAVYIWWQEQPKWGVVKHNGVLGSTENWWIILIHGSLSLSIPSIWHKYPNTTRVRLLVKRTTKYLLYVVIRALRLSLAILAHENKCINPFNSCGYSVHISLIIDGLPWWSQRTWYGCLLGSKALPL